MQQPKIAIVGLAVMGSNLIRNIESRGHPCVVYNRTSEVTDRFISEHQDKQFVAASSLEDMVSKLARPRQILVMVKAGGAVDAVIESLLPLLDQGDVIADLGNTYFKDTVRREKLCAESGINFLGVGVSGGEEGALKGPSIMPGGKREAWQNIAAVFDSISAKAPEPCHAYIGPDGAGHFVKMVHNGIEYADMQLIAEAYDLLRTLLKCEPNELADIFSEWNKGLLDSFLIEITSQIFQTKNDLGEGFLVDFVLDKAKQKGTGKWTAQLALDLGCPVPTISSAVDARCLSALKAERLEASKFLSFESNNSLNIDKKALIAAIHDALYCSKIVAYAQGMAMLSSASDEWNWDLKLSEIGAIWRGGCIIRARFLSEIMRSYSQDPKLANLLLDQKIKEHIQSRMGNWRQVVSLAAEYGIPVLAFSSALSYFDSYRSASLPQNLTQAQRDCFGAHTYERVDRDGSFHSGWG